MALDIVGAGFGRTGTLSLKYALEMLGFDRCYHMREIRLHHPEHRDIWSAAHRGEAVNWDALFEGYKAAVDWPTCNLWQELSTFYPQSKVILSIRNPQRWYDSIRNTIYASSMAAFHSEDQAEHRRGEWAREVIWQWVFDDRLDDKEHVVGVFNEHVARVKAAIPPERLLVFEASHGWAPLCEFLRCPVPEVPFPRVNSTDEFRSRSRLPDQKV
jgi:hypothetical protein